jgi:hypothetical protein
MDSTSRLEHALETFPCMCQQVVGGIMDQPYPQVEQISYTPFNPSPTYIVGHRRRLSQPEELLFCRSHTAPKQGMQQPYRQLHGDREWENRQHTEAKGCLYKRWLFRQATPPML